MPQHKAPGRRASATPLSAWCWLLQHHQVQPPLCPQCPRKTDATQGCAADHTQSSFRLELLLEGAPLLPTVLLVGRPVLLLALGAAVPGHLAAPADVELPELREHRTGASQSRRGATALDREGPASSPHGCRGPRGRREWSAQGARHSRTCFSIIVQGG